MWGLDPPARGVLDTTHTAKNSLNRSLSEVRVAPSGIFRVIVGVGGERERERIVHRRGRQSRVCDELVDAPELANDAKAGEVLLDYLAGQMDDCKDTENPLNTFLMRYCVLYCVAKPALAA